MAGPNRRVLDAALALMGQYGDDAEIIAVLRAAEYAAQGDAEALAEWDLIIECLAGLSEGPPPPSHIN